MPYDVDELLRKREQAERVFTARGHEFKIKPSVRPERLYEYGDWSLGLIEPRPNEERSIGILSNAIEQYLEDEYIDAWRRLREDDGPDALNIDDLFAIMDWIAEAMSGRPTRPSSTSSGGDGNRPTGTTSTEDSP